MLDYKVISICKLLGILKKFDTVFIIKLILNSTKAVFYRMYNVNFPFQFN